MSSQSQTITESVTEAVGEEVEFLADQNADSTDSNLRYAAYGARLRTALRAATRYVAYTSDIGEAFRPVVPPWVVTAAYGVSWLYLAGDVSYESYKAHRRGPTPLEAANFSEPARIGLVGVERAAFQSIASMALPALTIHTAVKQAKKAFDKVQTPRLRAWGPTVTGLAIVPILPYLYDHPVEHVTERVFDWIRVKIAEQRPRGKDEL
ncbi:mitochondrial 18 KDa protein-domain-containing protein [Roridomyces roridus]|uniref:Mitochondrial fission process protein 1 n=1 Tax=Roridomyces roridus TaxID=1738132 RepID=A0AAD7C4H7_9AGAR|nr:mitochondrial 18 KDa protein-domain-containing protein [Roridomyces roridus]